jgi:hypothetical protein
MSDRVKRFFEQRRQAAEGTWTPSEQSPEPQSDLEFRTTFFLADSIGSPLPGDPPSSSRTPRRIERFFQRRRDAEEGVWAPLPDMTLPSYAVAPHVLTPVSWHGAPLAQAEPEIVWNRPKPVRDAIVFRLDSTAPDDSSEARVLVRIASVCGAIIGSILVLKVIEFGTPLLLGSIVAFLFSFMRVDKPRLVLPLPKKPPQRAPFQFSWETTRPVAQPEPELSEMDQLALEELGLCEAGSSHHESA